MFRWNESNVNCLQGRISNFSFPESERKKVVSSSFGLFGSSRWPVLKNVSYSARSFTSGSCPAEPQCDPLGSRTTGAEHECWNCFKLLEKKNIHISVFLSRQSERSKSTIRLIVNHPEPLSHKIRIRSWSLTNTTHLNTSLSLSQRICTRTILGSGFSSFCVVLLMNQHQHNLLCRYYLYSPDLFPSPSTRWRLPEPAAARHEPRVLIISHVDFSLVLTNNPVYISLIRKDREKYSNYEKQRWLCDDGLHDTTWTAAAFCCLARGAVSARTNHETYLHS